MTVTRNKAKGLKEQIEHVEYQMLDDSGKKAQKQLKVLGKRVEPKDTTERNEPPVRSELAKRRRIKATSRAISKGRVHRPAPVVEKPAEQRQEEQADTGDGEVETAAADQSSVRPQVAHTTDNASTAWDPETSEVIDDIRATLASAPPPLTRPHQITRRSSATNRATTEQYTPLRRARSSRNFLYREKH